MIRRALLAVVVAALVAPAAAQANITLSNVHARPASTAAGAHSDFTLSFDLGGSETIKDLDPGEEDADGVRGGIVGQMTHTCNCQAVSNINCVAN